MSHKYTDPEPERLRNHLSKQIAQDLCTELGGDPAFDQFFGTRMTLPLFETDCSRFDFMATITFWKGCVNCDMSVVEKGGAGIAIRHAYREISQDAADPGFVKKIANRCKEMIDGAVELHGSRRTQTSQGLRAKV